MDEHRLLDSQPPGRSTQPPSQPQQQEPQEYDEFANVPLNYAATVASSASRFVVRAKQYCPVHPDVEATRYCPTHRVVQCMDCMDAEEHAHCAKSITVARAVELLQAEVSPKVSELYKHRSRIESDIQNLKAQESEVERLGKEVQAQIDAYYKELQVAFLNKFKTLRAEVDGLIQNDLEPISQRRERLQEIYRLATTDTQHALSDPASLNTLRVGIDDALKTMKEEDAVKPVVPTVGGKGPRYQFIPPISARDLIERSVQPATITVNKPLVVSQPIVWGSLGKESGQFQAIKGLSFTTDGNLLVADRMNNRLQELTADGTWIRTIGQSHMKLPTSVTVMNHNQQHILVAQGIQSNTKIQVYDFKSGNYLHSLDSLTNDQPFSITTHPSNGNVYILDVKNCIRGIKDSNTSNPQRLPLTIDGTGDVDYRALAIDAKSNTIAICDLQSCKVYLHNIADGKLKQTIGTKGKGDQQLMNPSNLTFNPHNNEIVICDDDNQRLSIWKLNGTFVKTVPLADVPWAVAVNDEGTLLAVAFRSSVSVMPYPSSS